MKEITGEIQAIIRQITASVTFLPLLNEPCAFDLLFYTDKQVRAYRRVHAIIYGTSCHRSH